MEWIEGFNVSEGGRWVQLRTMGHIAATDAGLKGDYLSDCAMDFVVDITVRSEGFENWSEEALQEKAARFARSMAFRLKRHNRRVKSLEETTRDGTAHAIPEPVSPELGPEALLQRADFLRRLLAPVGEFSPAQQHLFVGRLLRSKRLVDLEKETGRSADALSKSLANMIRRLRIMHEKNGISLEEITDELSQLDRGESCG
ncbi:MAG: hypothetical protein JWN14_2886 [Chthonomonadales bacterium]|nr:hypothetical protein [Chthonomonadales bacterium]